VAHKSPLFDIPEVPVQNSSERSRVLSSQTQQEVKRVVSTAREYESDVRKGKSSPQLYGFLLLVFVLIAGSFIFFSDKNPQRKAEPSNTAVEKVVEDSKVTSSEVAPTPTKSSAPISTSTSPTVQSRYIFTPTGIELIWELSDTENLDYIEITAAENAGKEISLGRFGSNSNSLELVKDDNQGVTTFKFTAVTKTGSKIMTPVLDVRGKFSVK
jgi:hypothetical protein